MSPVAQYKDLPILIVDDNAQNIQLVHSILEKNAYKNIAFATSGIKAIELAKTIQPALILLDIMMPLMDGYEVLRILKEDILTKDIAIIFLTAKANNEDVIEGFNLGVVDYITKPFDNQILLARTQNQLMLKFQTLQLEEEKKLLEQKVQSELEKRLKSNAKMLALYTQAHHGMSFLDKDGKFIDVNNKFGELLGYTTRELLKLNTETLTHPDDRQKSKELFKSIKNNQLKTLEVEKRCIKKDGSVIWFLIHLTRIEVPSDNDNFYIASTCEDISDKIALREEVKEKESMIVTQSRHAAMGNMVGMIAHQWRQPLSIIGMIANNIQLDVQFETPIEPKEINQHMNELHEQVNYLSDTIEDFKNYFKPNKEKALTKVDDVMEKSLNLIAKSFTNNNIKIEKEYSIETMINVFSNELMQVFINILNNAKDALLSNKIKNPKIMIHIFENENKIVVTIADNAGGIPLSSMDKIGNLYFSTKGEAGTGLGMFMSKTIIEKHLNGTLVWENRDDGALFSIVIPKERDKEIRL